MILSLAAAAALLPVLTGCSTGKSQVARGQTPAGAVVNAQGQEWCEEECPPRHCCRFCNGLGCCHCRPYCVPSDLSYPPANQPPAIVQYPYYTCKGPDCFFKKD
jgi:hypothetical protein